MKQGSDGSEGNETATEKTIAQKDVAQYQKDGTEQEKSSEETSKPTSDVNWLKAAATAQHLKEIVVILTAFGLLIWLMCVLTGLINAIIAIFTKAVHLHSAPIKVVETMDWHVLGLGVSLVVAISAVAIILMKSVFAANSKQTPDGLKLSDLPVGELLEGIKSWFKR
ncbi:hypothetical protein F471_03705 [Pseudomonas sp. URMO17WK12:I1]|uniref:hypothetical protein n=1 Tax=unclassified Pseudomonas TaxID=196821 RepID=UPI000DB2B811|nr:MULTISPECIES: hypothetical protein [unclassified Pseudomonas]PZW65227.1 hypothetical protein F471_03705 [Pseudomonas sp. URMO17WK12:I1]